MNKIIKTIIAIVTAITLCSILLTGCSESDPAVGTWKVTAASMNGESVDISEFGNIEMRLNADGTAILNSDGEYAESIWSRDGDTLMIDGEKYQLDGNVITTNLSDGTASMYLKFIRA